MSQQGSWRNKGDRKPAQVPNYMWPGDISISMFRDNRVFLAKCVH